MVVTPLPTVQPLDERPAPPERKQTDESLRVEREKADDAIGEPTAGDETADLVVEKARARADAVLATARDKADLRLANGAATAGATAGVERQRDREDQTVENERASADETVRVARAEQGALLAVEREVTDNDLSRERARSDRAVETRDEFLGIVGHDLRNMLGAMVGFAEHIASVGSQQGRGDQVVVLARRIQRAGARMDRLVGDLLDVASIEAGRLGVTREVADPVAVVTEAVDMLHGQATASGVSLTMELEAPLPAASFDPARILQVLINLLGNAIKFTPPNGRVVVHVEHDGGELRFTVRDTGAGIPAEKLESMFERFAQVAKYDRRGVGLGLYISKCIVEGHGGRIWAESKMGDGSMFSFALPLHVAS